MDSEIDVLSVSATRITLVACRLRGVYLYLVDVGPNWEIDHLDTAESESGLVSDFLRSLRRTTSHTWPCTTGQGLG